MSNEYLQTRICDLVELNVRVRNVLIKAGLETLQDVVTAGRTKVSNLLVLNKWMHDMDDCLKERGLSLVDPVEDEKDWEPMRGYCMSEEGTYYSPVELKSADALMSFISENVEKYYELRVTDMLDNCTMHIVDRALIFPLPLGRSANNKWDIKKQRFVENGK